MLDMYLPAFLSVIYANELPKDAVGRAEAAFRPAAFRPPSETESENREAGE